MSLSVALTKGRLEKKTVAMLERCDYGIKHTDELNEYVNQMMQRMNKTIKMNLLTKSIYTL